jgi:hypothetical protein
MGYAIDLDRYSCPPPRTIQNQARETKGMHRSSRQTDGFVRHAGRVTSCLFSESEGVPVPAGTGQAPLRAAPVRC